MQTKEAYETRLTFIIAVIVSVAIAVWLPAAPAHALTVTIKVNGATCATAGSATATTVTLSMNACGVTISPQPGFSAAQAVALATSGSQNQVVIRNALIKNTAALGTAASRNVQITAVHLFASTPVGSGAQRAYGIGLNASFARKNASNIAVLASGNGVTKQGFYAYNCTGCSDKIGVAVGSGQDLTYGVPSTGSTTQNTIPIPSPNASESPRNCASFGKGCSNGETLTTILTVLLTKGQDTATIPGGDHTVGGGCDKKANKNCGQPGSEDLTTGFVDGILALLSAAAKLHQNTPNPSININDNGFLTVDLTCNPDFPCENIDQASLRFGHAPTGPAVPVDVRLVDLNHDGVVDLQAKFRNQETGIVCGDTMASLSGTTTLPGVGLQEFDAPVGFDTTQPGGCPAP